MTDEPSTEHLRETVIDRRVVHHGYYMDFREDSIRGPDGREHTRDIVDHPGAVAIVAIDDQDRVLLVRQWRAAIDQALLEIPAGTLDRLESGIESPDVAAPRELAEETGMRAGSWRKLGHFWTAPGFATEDMHIYLAEDLTPIDGYAGAEPDENLELVRQPWQEAVQQCLDGRYHDAKTMLGILWVDRVRGAG